MRGPADITKEIHDGKYPRETITVVVMYCMIISINICVGLLTTVCAVQCVKRLVVAHRYLV